MPVTSELLLRPAPLKVKSAGQDAQEPKRRAPAPVSVFTGLDTWLLASSLTLLMISLLMVTSASMPIADYNSSQPFQYLLRQGFYIAFALAAAGFVFRLPVQRWYDWHVVLLLATIALLVLVLLIGKEINGSTRWIRFGAVNIQVSELAKLFTLIYIAGYLQRNKKSLDTSLLIMLRAMLVLALLALLLLLEPDFGAAAVLIATALGVMFLAGVNFWRFALVLATTASAMTLLLYSSDYRRERLIGFLDPWNDPFGSGFQLVQSLIAIGRGELFGVGLGASVQKMFYLPEAYTDFLFAILAEEFGLVGVLAIIGLYSLLIWRSFIISAHAERLERWFAANLAYGIGLLFAIQALVNMGVNMGMLPTKGLTLPLLSYGGSSMLVMCVAVAILLRIGRENHSRDPRRQRQQKNAPERAQQKGSSADA